MKKRQGFVSNSSSSSFVCIGVQIEESEISFMELAELFMGIKKEDLIKKMSPENKEEYEKADDIDKKEILENELEEHMYEYDRYGDEIRVETGGDKFPSGSYVIAKYLSESEDYMENKNYNFSEIYDEMKEINEKLGNKGIIKIFLGTANS